MVKKPKNDNKKIRDLNFGTVEPTYFFVWPYMKCELPFTEPVPGPVRNTPRENWELFCRATYKMAEQDGRNFRSFYYETLGLRNVDQKKALEFLLKDDPIGNTIGLAKSSCFSPR